MKFLYLNITVAGPVELDPEYQLIVEANNLTVEIDNEISKYSKTCLKRPLKKGQNKGLKDKW